MKLAILKNESDDIYPNWVEACEKENINYEVIDLMKSNWLDQIRRKTFDGLLACPSGRQSIYKQIYDEKIYILENELNYFVYPSFREISIHENKRFLSYWLKANNLHHQDTWVFYDKKEALLFSKNTALPIVGKFNIGASGKGVKIIRENKELEKYIETAFSDGLKQSWGPNLKMGSNIHRLKKILKNPKRIFERFKVYKKNYDEKQKGFLLLQKYISHKYEWRIVKIGNSFFGHQKIKKGDKASGTKGINYIQPPINLLNFVDNICENHGFNSMSVDLFEDGKGQYYINEMQCTFGHVQEYICEKDGKPGRFVKKQNKWIFEEGMFNTNLSYDLRLKNALSIIKSNF